MWPERTPLRVVIADDDEAYAELVAALLRRAGPHQRGARGRSDGVHQQAERARRPRLDAARARGRPGGARGLSPGKRADRLAISRLPWPKWTESRPLWTLATARSSTRCPTCCCGCGRTARTSRSVVTSRSS